MATDKDPFTTLEGKLIIFRALDIAFPPSKRYQWQISALLRLHLRFGIQILVKSNAMFPVKFWCNFRCCLFKEKTTTIKLDEVK